MKSLIAFMTIVNCLALLGNIIILHIRVSRLERAAVAKEK